MPLKRSYDPIEVFVTDGGRLLPDLPPARIGPANYREKINFRRGDGEEEKIEGWDYPAPTDTWDGGGVTNFHDGLPAEAIRQVRRANGSVAIVGCGWGFIKRFDYDSNAWVTIGSGYGVPGDINFRFWQIEDIASYAVFNNGRDLTCTWQIGDAEVTPIYQLREAGYASVGDICGFNGILRCADILEINDDAMEDVMSDPLPYKTIVDSDFTTRINYRQIWSNIDDPRDFGATVSGSMTAGFGSVVLQWPVASFTTGDIVYVVGAGAEGGNLRSTIIAVDGDGMTIHLADNAVGTVTDALVFHESALETIVGYNDLADDGSAIVRQMVLKNRLISLKASGHVFEEYYNGDLEKPFIAEQMTKTPRALRFPRALANVADRYLLFPADRHFYRYSVGSQELEEDKTLFGCEKSLFFDRVVGLGKYDVWAADNTCTGEIYFAYPLPAAEDEDPTPDPDPEPPEPILYWNTEQEACNVCPEGFSGEPVCYTQPAHTFSSTESQADADAQAFAEAQRIADALRYLTPCIENPPDPGEESSLSADYRYKEGSAECDPDSFGSSGDAVAYSGSGNATEGCIDAFGQPAAASASVGPIAIYETGDGIYGTVRYGNLSWAWIRQTYSLPCGIAHDVIVGCVSADNDISWNGAIGGGVGEIVLSRDPAHNPYRFGIIIVFDLVGTQVQCPDSYVYIDVGDVIFTGCKTAVDGVVDDEGEPWLTGDADTTAYFTVVGDNDTVNFLALQVQVTAGEEEPLTIGDDYQIIVSFKRRATGTADPFVDADESENEVIEFTATDLTHVTDWITVPNLAGYDTRVSDIVLVHIIP